MKYIIKNSLLAISSVLLLNSCESVDFGDINNNPNGPTAAVTSQLLTEAQKTVSTIGTHLAGILYTQQLTEGQYPGESRYATLTYSYNGYYTGPIQNLNEIIKLNSEEASKDKANLYGNNNNQIAVAKILRAYILQFMTDRWGALPWTEAFQGIDNPQPKFDSQEELYNIMFDEVEEALSLINNNAGPQGDILFYGDMSKWRIFGNSLKMTMALRISDANPSLAKSKFEEAVSSGNIITDNAQNILFKYGTDDASDSPWRDRFRTREDYVVSETMMEALRSNLDPRIFKFASPSRTGTATNPLFPDNLDLTYVGAPNGKVNGNVPDFSFPPADLISTPDIPTPIYTAAQMKLAMAEGAMKGWSVGKNSETLFIDGIKASMSQWGVEDNEIESYISKYNGAPSITEIAYEKWLALYLNGPESWAEWRRLDSPNLTPSEFAGDPRIPVRHAYDSSVEDNNKTNYDLVVSQQGIDDLHTKLWWDKN